MGPPRTGPHPRDPRPRAKTHLSADASGMDVQDDDDDEGEPPNEPGSSSARPSDGPQYTTPTPVPDAESQNPRRGGGPDTTQRVRRTYHDQGAGHARLPDWTRFDIQISLRNLRSWNPAVIRKELRKLHLRWWHAKEPKMRELLQAAGLDKARLDFIKPVVDACRECRAWQRPGHSILPSVSLPTKFNENGECDLLFYKRHIAYHIIDCAIRLSDGCEIHNKETPTL